MRCAGGEGWEEGGLFHGDRVLTESQHGSVRSVEVRGEGGEGEELEGGRREEGGGRREEGGVPIVD